MGFSTTTWSNLKSAALLRLGNSSFWSSAEIELYLNEALRIWSIWTRQWNSAYSVTPATGTSSVTPSFITSTTADTQILNEIQYQTLETPNSGVSMTTDLWTIAEVINFLRRRSDRFSNHGKLRVTNLNLTTSIGDPLLDLANDRIGEIVRVDYVNKSLYKTDAWIMDNGLVGWSTGTPVAYDVLMSGDRRKLRLYPSPTAVGAVKVYAVTMGTALSNAGVTVNVPDDFVPYLKWGALSDMFAKEGPSYDSLRAQYAEARFAEGLLAANEWMLKRELRVAIGSTEIYKVSLLELDSGWADWKTLANGKPLRYSPVGAFSLLINPPTNGTHAISVWGTSMANIPVTDLSYIDLGEWEIGLILDYVEHIALFKLGGAEFERSFGLLERFLKAASKRSQQLDLCNKFRKWMGRDIDLGQETVNADKS